MNTDVQFTESKQTFNPAFADVVNISDGGYERGYTAGLDAGYKSGYAEGLANRQYETWTFTMTDGSVVEKEVALL